MVAISKCSARADVRAPIDRPTLLIDLDALAANYHTIVREVGSAVVAPVLKAEAYGLGAGPVGRRLWQEGARTFFVARLSEAETLRAQLGPGRRARIWVLDGCLEGQLPRFVDANLSPVLNSLQQVERCMTYAAEGRRLPELALQVETGLNRLGISIAELMQVTGDRNGAQDLQISLLLSHLACADDPSHPLNDRQSRTFDQLRRLFPSTPMSLAASDGIVLGEGFWRHLVRPGISLFGGGARGVSDERVRAVATLVAPILQIKEVQAGDSVGYGASYVASSKVRLAIVSAGYADGVPRNWFGKVWVGDHYCPCVGRVSMDVIVVDVSAVPNISTADVVEFFGANLSIDNVASDAGTIAYEILSRVGARVARRYLDEGEVVG